MPCSDKISLPCQYLLSFTSGTCEDSEQTFLTQEYGKYQDMPDYDVPLKSGHLEKLQSQKLLVYFE